jgi:hypothetical protein
VFSQCRGGEGGARWRRRGWRGCGGWWVVGGGWWVVGGGWSVHTVYACVQCVQGVVVFGVEGAAASATHESFLQYL